MGNSNHARPTWPDGWHVEEVAETGSTNADLLARAGQLPDRSVLRADHQTAGRGRLDRRWDAPPGANLLVSFLFHLPAGADPAAAAAERVRRVGVAAVDAMRRLRPASAGEIGLKWPNDVMIGHRKAAGILAQIGPAGSVVVGIGLNVAWAPDGAACLAPDGSLRPDEVLAGLLEAYNALPPDVDGPYRELLVTLGQRVRIELPGGRELVGDAIRVDRDGALVVVDDTRIMHRVTVGDVVHLRPA